MDLQEVWRKLEKDKLSQPVLGAATVTKKSKHPVQKLKNAYLMTTAFSVICLIFFVYLLTTSHERLVKGSLILVILAYVFFFVVNFSMFRKIKVAFPVDQSLKIVLQHSYRFIVSNIQFQERVSLFIYPIAGAAGFFIGGAESADLESLMRKPVVVVSFFLTLIILTPLCYYLTKWMYKVSYGKCLIELKSLIDELEKPEEISSSIS